MRRRMLVPALLAGLVLYAAPVLAQQPLPALVPRVGILTPAESDQTPIFEAFRRGLKDLGYTEGRNIAVEFRSAQGNSALLPRLAAELVALPVDIILTDGAAAARAAQEATRVRAHGRPSRLRPRPNGALSPSGGADTQDP